MAKWIEIMIDSGSRPFLLKKTLPKMIEHFKFSGNLRWLFHEAVLDTELSKENIAYASSLKLFSEIVATVDPAGEAVSINTILDKTWMSKYFIHVEDDYLFKRDVDLDVMFDIFEASPDVNQIAFNRRDTMVEVAGWFKGEYEKGGHTLTTSPHWRFTPAMWRLDWIKPRWEPFAGSNGHWAINKKLQKGVTENSELKTHKWVAENLGTFYYGPIGERRFCRHIGYGHSNRGVK
jgi:hypothetical protein